MTTAAGVVVTGGYVIPRDIAEDPTRFSYWRREAHAFASGRLDDLPGPVVAPRCFGIHERSGECVWLWLEEVATGSAVPWSPVHYRRAGHDLGQFNGRYLGSTRAAEADWMSHGWLRSWLQTAIAGYVPFLEAPTAEQHWGMAWEDILQSRAGLANLLVDRADEARDMLRAV